jgi:hypothetical protein
MPEWPSLAQACGEMELPPIHPDTAPGLYREILDLVAELERAPGGRAESERLRSQAIDAYSSGWDHRREQRLVRLRARLLADLGRRRVIRRDRDP